MQQQKLQSIGQSLLLSDNNAHVKKLIVLIHKCIDYKSSKHIYYNVFKDTAKEKDI